MGFMHQITVGAAYQVCIDPFGPAWGFIRNPLAGAPVMGGPFPLVGGDVQVSFGRKLDTVYGPSISTNYGDQITIGGDPSPLTQCLAGLVPLLSLAYQICFGLMFTKEDDEQGSDRAEAFSAIVLAIRLVNGALTNSETADRIATVAKRAIIAKQEDTQLATCLAIAGSTLIPDHMKKTILDAMVNRRAMTPELPLTPVDDANDINIVDGAFIQVAESIQLVATKDPRGSRVRSGAQHDLHQCRRQGRRWSGLRQRNQGSDTRRPTRRNDRDVQGRYQNRGRTDGPDQDRVRSAVGRSPRSEWIL